ncbi:hypothetical protein QJS04_geneDACA003621 [Acorus gramineus]|uniref:Uncharacterized protein n=1 Tax=Acorus gramineus TaxID=55184 RepID=A0AAV9BP33_ACOGR|nr:hypothetical protein QJS04_geneDACA003621 [Acorus gramineus]
MASPSSDHLSSLAVHDTGADDREENKMTVEHPQVDPFLVEALQNPRHRLTVLRMEMDIQRFLQNAELNQFEFQHFPTSYLRLAAHRVAQHYGLQTMVDNLTDGSGSKIIVSKTPESHFPTIRLSDIPAKQPENEIPEHVKIVICSRPQRNSPGDASELGTKQSPVRTVEERKEEYDRARARIFSSPSSPESEAGIYSQVTADRRSPCSSRDENEGFRSSSPDESEKIIFKDGTSRVAIFRDREKDRSDPDYDRSYDRYMRGLVPSQNFGLGPFNMLQPPFIQYETGFSQLGQLPRTQASACYGPSSPVMGPFCATARDPVYVQWPNTAMVYAQSYEQVRHAFVQAPFYQQPLSFEHSQNR